MPRSLARWHMGCSYREGRGRPPDPANGPAWYAWLEPHISFAFSTPAPSTVRKERGRPGGWYWKAYRRMGGKVRTAYLGRTADLTLARLHAAVATWPPAAPTPPQERLPPPRPVRAARPARRGRVSYPTTSSCRRPARNGCAGPACATASARTPHR